LAPNWKKALRGFQMDKMVLEMSQKQHLPLNPTMVDVKPNAWTQLQVKHDGRKKKEASDAMRDGVANQFLAGFARGQEVSFSLSKSSI
jgi:hypothetical protein